MKLLNILLFLFLGFTSSMAEDDNPPTLEIGSKAPDFLLKGTDGKMYSLKNFSSSKILVVLFTCNHCPTAQAYEDRVLAFDKKYAAKGVKLVAISPNSDKAVRFDELGYTDLSDSYSDMVKRAKDKKFTFPYLYDGETQNVAKAYGPSTTPQVFVFDSQRILRYVGRIDDNEHLGKEKTYDLQNAVDQMLNNEPVAVTKTKTFGCSIKWASKIPWRLKEIEEWKKELVGVKTADIATLKSIIGPSEKYRLVNFWATWCGPCVAEFSSLVEMDKMYRNRDFELITVSTDGYVDSTRVKKFLVKKYASNPNYQFGSLEKYKMMDAVDSKWQGALPYTLFISPKGEVIYRKEGMIEPEKLKKVIADNIGRVYP